MHINDLPSDVLLSVFQETLPATKNRPADIKDGLVLLSVCRWWRQIAPPLAYDTVYIKCSRAALSIEDGPEDVSIKTMLDLVANTGPIQMVRRVVIDVHYNDNPLPGLREVIARMRKAADEWTGVRQLELSTDTHCLAYRGVYTPLAEYEDEISSVSSALAAVMPGLRQIKFGDARQTQIACLLYGQLVGFHANQLQVLHSNFLPAVPQDPVFVQLRDVDIKGSHLDSLEGQLLRLNPEAIESLVLDLFSANDMWSMFCTDTDGYAIAFPRLTDLRLSNVLRSLTASEQQPAERPWALQFPAVKRVHVSYYGVPSPSLENAVFPAHLESLDISASWDILPVFSTTNVQASRNLSLSIEYDFGEDIANFEVANRLLAASDSCKVKKLTVNGTDDVPLDLITYTGITHLYLLAEVSVDDVLELINRQQHLVSLQVAYFDLFDIHADISIPECAEHELVVPLDTQLRELTLRDDSGPEIPIFKYLLVRIPTLRVVTTGAFAYQQLHTFVDDYVQWYPHLANIKLNA